MDKPRIISSDSHVVEQRDLWTSRMPSKFKDRAPHIVSEEDADWWFCDGRKVASLAIGTQVGLRFEAPEKLKQEFRYEEVRLGGYIPGEQVKDNEADGVDVAVIYPSIAFTMYRGVPDSELLTAVFSVYNDWVGEFCGAYPDRLKGIALLNTDDVQVAVKELNRCANLGFIGAMIPRISMKTGATTYQILTPYGQPPRTWRSPLVSTRAHIVLVRRLSRNFSSWATKTPYISGTQPRPS